jgi:hypothetical protein
VVHEGSYSQPVIVEPNPKSSTISALPYRHDVRGLPKFIEMVSPYLHHSDALLPVFGSVGVSAAPAP